MFFLFGVSIDLVETLTTEEFYSKGMSGKLLGLRCENGHITAPPRHSCSTCRSQKLSIIELSGFGNIVEYTEVNSKSNDFPLETPYNLGIVKLDEGPNLLGIVEAKPEKDGVRVKVSFRALTQSERPRIFFEIQ
jgi:uncharacterized OB-fold protein